MTDSNDSHNRDCTSSANPKISEISEPFVIKPDAIYSRKYLMMVMGISKNTFTKWKERGLKKLNTNTKEDLYFGLDLITLFRSQG